MASMLGFQVLSIENEKFLSFIISWKSESTLVHVAGSNFPVQYWLTAGLKSVCGCLKSVAISTETIYLQVRRKALVYTVNTVKLNKRNFSFSLIYF